MSSDNLPECSLLDCITDNDARFKFVQQNLNNLAIIFLLKSCEKAEKKVEAPKPTKSKRGRKPKPKPNPKMKKNEKEEYKHIIEVFKKWNKTHDVSNICSCGVCKFCTISESVKNCSSKKVETGKRKYKGTVQQQEFVQCEVCDWPDDLQELLHDWDKLPETSNASNLNTEIEKYLAEHNKPDMYELYRVEEKVSVSPVKNGKKSARTGRSSARSTTQKSVRRGLPQTGRGGSNAVKCRRSSHRCVPSAPSTETNENGVPTEDDENNTENDKFELSSKSDTLSSKAAIVDKVSVEFTKCLPYDILQLRPTLAENYDKAKVSDYFLNSK